jgi:dynein heavy chain
MLYFLCIALCVLSHMYQYSLESFKNFFFKAMDETVEQGAERIGALRKKIRYVIFQWVSRGLFVAHKLIFLTLVTFRLMQKGVVQAEFEQRDMDFLLNCIPKTGEPNPIDEWLPNNNWNLVQRLIELPRFTTFSNNMVSDAPTRFKDWFNSLNPETENLPLEWKALKDFPF